MGTLRRYRKKSDQFVVAVKLDLDTEGFTYRKWGGEQKCNKGDWLVDNNGDVYTINSNSFEETYRHIGGGKYIKVATVWAEVATSKGTIKTKEGESHYEPGDYLVYNKKDKTDGYRVRAEKFESMYELDE